MTTEMPENIWIYKDNAVSSGWYDFEPREPVTQYTRTDLVAAKLAAAEKIRAAFEKQWPNWEKYPSGNYVDEIIQSYWQRFEEGWKAAVAEWENVK